MDDRLNYYLAALVAYGRREQLLESDEDEIYALNRLLAVFKQTDYQAPELSETELAELNELSLADILQGLLVEADSLNLVDTTSVVLSDLFDSQLMNCLLPRPSEVKRKFQALYAESPKAATDYFYHFSQESDYIRRYRISKDVKWQTDTEYGPLDITINLSKPEKDPRAIKQAAQQKASSYPKCMLCKESMGYAGRLNYPGRSNHRILPLELANERWYFQYSPYVYYNEHCIVLSAEHRPMKICNLTFERLLDFIDQFPHYCIGSNADLPIVGGSILSHDHFQGGHYTFPMQRAKVLFNLPSLAKYPDVEVAYLNWPLSVIRLSAKARKPVSELASLILQAWRTYTDAELNIYASTGEGKNLEKHNTITPIARKHEGKYELYLVLRNNLTTDEHPLGVYHPHADKHHIKKENIGLIEVMGLAVLPARLKSELHDLQVLLAKGETGENDSRLAIHAKWAGELLAKYGAKAFKSETGQAILAKETGLVFKGCLEDAGVYKLNQAGETGVKRFFEAVSKLASI